MKSIATSLFAFAFTLSLGVASPVEADVWNVNPQGTGDAPTIQAAYDLATAGDVIILAPGTYVDSHTRTINGYGPSEFPSTTSNRFHESRSRSGELQRCGRNHH